MKYSFGSILDDHLKTEIYFFKTSVLTPEHTKYFPLERISLIRTQPIVWACCALLWFFELENFACKVFLGHFSFRSKNFNLTILLAPDEKHDFPKLVEFGFE